MENWMNRSCEEYIAALSSRDPVPGGGGTAALVGALGVALGSMVGNLTLCKKRYADVEPDIRACLEKSEDLTHRLEALVTEDTVAFQPLSEAYRMPAETEEEKQKKNQAIQRHLPAAAAVPMEIARLCVEALRLHRTFAEKGSVLAISDAGCGAVLCRSALQCARLNVEINLSAMVDETLRESLQEEIDALTKQGINEADAIFQYVEERL